MVFEPFGVDKGMIRIIGPRDSRPEGVIDTTSRSRDWSRGLSPFLVGPVPLYPGAGPPFSQTMEGAWQFSKVYPEHVGSNGEPTEQYWKWARAGWHDSRAHRYPMGKGRVPKFSWWDGQPLGYIEARKAIYVPLYARAVAETQAFGMLLALYREEGEATLWDFDGYDHHALGMSYKDVVNDPKRKMGHAFVLGYLLEQLNGEGHDGQG